MFYKLWLIGVTIRLLEVLPKDVEHRQHGSGHVVWNQRREFL